MFEIDHKNLKNIASEAAYVCPLHSILTCIYPTIHIHTFKKTWSTSFGFVCKVNMTGIICKIGVNVKLGELTQYLNREKVDTSAVYMKVDEYIKWE